VDAAVIVLLAAGAYLVGSVSFARIVARRVLRGEDISSTTLEYRGVSATAVGARTAPSGACWPAWVTC
jgi:glycerol-3-phosphate acyltransferase PlsY